MINEIVTSIEEDGKDTKISRATQKIRLINLLLNGGMFSTRDFVDRLRISDPRAVIRDLRKKGYHIGDEWVTSEYTGARYKKYFLKKENKNE